MTKALALTSGGLDSILAARLIKEQGIEVIGICFKSAFFGSKNAERMAGQIGIPLLVIDFTEEHLKMTKAPKHGYGKNMNPCIDCHAMMLNYAGKMLDELDADFLITGEVLNQRPMSQNRKALDIVKEESGFEKKILRPLCALNLPETEMERNGLVQRDKLMGISGKSRKPQMELAEHFGVVEYPTPAGGCLLTEPQFADRLRDLYEHDKQNASPNDAALLKVGRHFRISPDVKAIGTRSKDEYDILMGLLKEDHLVMNTADCAGSTTAVIMREGCSASDQELELIAAITARYSKEKDSEQVRVKIRKGIDGTEELRVVKPLADEQLREYLL